MSHPFGDLLAAYARNNPQRVCIIYGTQKETWSALNERVNRLANALRELGVKKGDVGIVMFHNCPAFVESVCALQKLGAIPSLMNYRFVPREIEYQANHSDAVVFLTEKAWAETVRGAMPNMPNVRHYICTDAATASSVSNGMLDYEELIKNAPSDDVGVDVSLDDVCVLPYTGGTTGVPKGVVHTYNEFFKHYEGLLGLLVKTPLNMPSLGEISFESADQVKDIFETLFDTGFLCVPPLFHMASFGVIMESLWLQLGAFPMVFPTSPKFDPREILEIIDALKPAAMWMVPTMWSKLLMLPEIEEHDTSSLVLVATGAGVCPGELKKRILQRFSNAIMMDAFGQSEMAPIATMKIDSPADIDNIKDRSVGSPLSTVVVRVVNEAGEDVPQGEVGEILYKSETVMKGYYKEPDKTSDVLTKEGWFSSGDLGSVDESGELIIVDRKTETINVGGEKIYPSEVEEIIEAHPAVEHACLIAVPDAVYGKIPRAVVQLHDGARLTEADVIEWCTGKMAGFKRPKSVVFAEALPLNPVGKVIRRDVEKHYGVSV